MNSSRPKCIGRGGEKKHSLFSHHLKVVSVYTKLQISESRCADHVVLLHAC